MMAAAPTREQVALGNPSFVWRSGQDRRLNLIRRYVPLEGARMLDIGCGIGTYVRKLREFSDQVYGIDVDRSRVDQGERGSLATGASERLPFEDGAFDAVLLNEVIEHVTDDAAALQEACRVVRRGGHVVIYAPNRLYPFETHGIYVGKKYIFGNIPLVNYLPDVLRRKLVPHARAYTRSAVQRIMKGLPARVVAQRYVYPGFDNIAGRSKAAAWFLRNVFYRLEETPLRIFGLSHFVVLRVERRSSGANG
jgi:ubiquinone/menaquinone biosynthesis C-methylase UbiE